MDNKNNHKNQHSQDNRVDFSNPPEGYLYCMIPIDEEFLELEPDLDPDYITVRFIGSRRQLVYMQLWTEREAREYNQSFKNEIHAEDRSRRCMVTSPKTGKMIRCPDDRSCVGCPFNDAMKQERSSSLSLDQMQEAGIETEAHGNVEDEVIGKDLELEILAELSSTNRKLVEIFERMTDGKKPVEIGEELGIRKSTLYDGIAKIRKITKKHLNQ